MNILRKKRFTFSSTPTPVIINPDGIITEKLQMTGKFSSSYYFCLIMYKGDFEPISSYDIIDFSKNGFKDQNLNCKVMGLVRDSSTIVDECKWMVKPLLEEKGRNFVAFACMSSPELGQENNGLIQALGVPLVECSPMPIETTIILISDRKNKVLYCTSFNPNIPRSVEETLRVGAAIKMVDEAEDPFLPLQTERVHNPLSRTSELGFSKKRSYDDRTKKSGLWLSFKKLLFGGHV